MALVDTTTGEVMADISAEDARDLTDKIKVTVEGAWHLIKQAYESRAWAALGYSSWDDYCTREFGGSRLRLPREERQEVVASLRDAGLSTRAIAVATGIDRKTVRGDLVQVGEMGPPDEESSIENDDHCGIEGHGWHLGECPGSSGDTELDGLLGGLEDAIARSSAKRATATPVPTEPKTITGTDGKKYAAPIPKSKPKRPALNDQAQRAGWEFRKATERLERIVGDDRFAANREAVAAALRGHLSYAVEVCQDLLDRLDHQS